MSRNRLLPLIAFGMILTGQPGLVQSFEIVQISNPTKSGGIVRNYHIPPSDSDREVIHYIITTMGNKSLAKIWKERNTLKKEGDKIASLHPLHFLLCIFTDEDTKAAMASLKGRSWVWGEFKKGLFVTLTEEQEKRNIKLEFIQDFAQKVGVDVAVILPSIKQCDWDELVAQLIQNVPREGDPTRYDM